MKKKILLQEFFYGLTGALFIFGLLEIFWPRLVLAYINLNWLVLAWLAAGLVLLAISRENS